MKLSWDENLPQSLKREFQAWLNKAHFLNYCKIPRRRVIGPFDECSITLHCLSDTSKSAFEASVFRRESYQGNTSVRLIQSKARVAPTKATTIPHLKLLEALISACMYTQVVEALNLRNCKVWFWCDSSVVLIWMKRDSCWNTFVGNCVAEIRKLTDPKDWYIVPVTMKSADLLSRGYPELSLEEQRKTAVCISSTNQNGFDILAKFPTWNKLKRVVAWF
ncbi:hypothetical protein HNY73_023222 [Argiope bruennichi]|uniref:Uncharacterized protein n=1 Tax=Argiope bruennichi TaxID=94029 RepID=A0A8T0E4H6_ARGBR|nr:hypothetical protein HNY73_023222 [Argiope bruennichi]